MYTVGREGCEDEDDRLFLSRCESLRDLNASLQTLGTMEGSELSRDITRLPFKKMAQEAALTGGDQAGNCSNHPDKR